jgi:methyl-accepting chemotaxis protein
VVVQTAVEVWIAELLAHEARRAHEVQRLVLDHQGSINLRAREEDVSTDLARAVSRALAMMHRTVVQVKDTAAEILHTSRHLERGNSDLAGRTEEQSASLEQTSASIGALAATVRGNSRSALQAADMAVGAAEVAARGGVAVRQVVGTMSEIERASKKIADIIGIIDGIAFQTNILALNAAVEAARAGEHGRGFAVVAAEVRSLAQRSAAAARETKVLIDESSGRVGAGSRLAQDAGATMDEMVAAVQGVRDLIGDIAGASKQQLVSIEEVARAISRMEEVTQRNAALVQDSAQAATRMAGQSSALAQAVAHFDTEPGTVPLASDLDSLALPVVRGPRPLLAG